MKAKVRFFAAMTIAAGALTATAQLSGVLDVPDAWKDATVENPVECTQDYLVNPNFDEGKTGWTNPGSTTYWDGSAEMSSMEKWNTAFDTYQEVVLPAGIYELRVNAFYRAGDINNAQGLRKTALENGEESEPLNCFYYAGASEKAVVSTFSETNKCSNKDAGDSDYGKVPNGMYSAEEAFANGAYKNSGLYFVSDGTSPVRIGIKKTQENTISYDWVVFDSFQLFYCGESEEAYLLVMDQILPNIDVTYYTETVNGLVSEKMISDFSAAYEALVAANNSKTGVVAAVKALNAAKGVIDRYIAGDDELTKIKAFYNQNEADLREDLATALNSAIAAAEKAFSEYGNTDAAIESLREAYNPANTYIDHLSTILSAAEPAAMYSVRKALLDELSTLKAAAESSLASDDQEAIQVAVNKVLAICDSIKADSKALDDLASYLEGAREFTQEFKDEERMDEYMTMYGNAEDQVGYCEDGETESITYSAAYAKYQVEAMHDLEQAIRGAALKPGDDVTKWLTNPGFDDGINGWTKEGPNPAVSNSECEVYEGGKFKIYQTLKNIKAGVYVIRCQAFVRPGWGASNDLKDIESYIIGNKNKSKIKNLGSDARSDEEGGKLYIDNNDESAWFSDKSWNDNGVTRYYPNCMAGARAYFDDETYTDPVTGNKGRYWNEVKVFVSKEDPDLVVGFEGDQHGIGGYWTLFDNFQIVYAGMDFEVIYDMCQAAIAEARELQQSPMEASIKSTLDQLILKADTAIAEQSGDKMMDVYPLFLDHIAKINASVNLYKKINDAIGKYEMLAITLGEDLPEGDATLAALNTLVSTTEAGYEAGKYSDADYDKIVADFNKLYNELKLKNVKFENATAENPVDASILIDDNDFLGDKTFWIGTEMTKRDGIGCEFWNTSFETKQVITGIPSGAYEFSYLAFYREGDISQARQLYAEGKANEEHCVYAYANNVAQKVQPEGVGMVKSSELTYDEDGNCYLYDEATETNTNPTTYGDKIVFTNAEGQQDSVYIANSQTQAYLALRDGRYEKQSIIVWVDETCDNTLEIGFKNKDYKGSDWIVFYSANLRYFGNGEDAVALGVDKVTGEAEVMSTAVFGIDGSAVGSIRKGVNLVRQIMSDGSIRVKKVIVK